MDEHRVDVWWEDRRLCARGVHRVVVAAETETKAMLIAAQMVASRKLHVVGTAYVP